MNYCRVPIILSYLALGYIIASLLYLLLTRSLGTPFYDAVKKIPSLMKIKEKSASKRGLMFLIGILISILILIIWRPFKSCN